MDAVCESLTTVTDGQLSELVINLPPGMSKSLLVSVLWPAWTWAETPSHRWICASYDDDLALDLARKMRTLVTSTWYRQCWPAVHLPDDASASKAAGLFYNTAGGMRCSITPRGGATGKHGNTVVVDDPVDPRGAGALSGVEIDDVQRWWTQTMPTRFVDLKTARKVLVMQRLHERDLTAEFIRAGAHVLCLPMRFERAHPHRWPCDPRTQEGELLCPERAPEDVVTRLETILGPTATAAQLQQRPSPAGGNIFRRAWLQHYWSVLPHGAWQGGGGGTWSQSWDMSFVDTKHADFVCGQVWYQKDAFFYLVDQVLSRMDFTTTCDAVLSLSTKYPQAIKKRVENKANGPAVVSALKRVVTGFEEVNPEGGKVARAFACEPLFSAGNVLLPHPTQAEYPDGRRGAPWVRGPGVTLEAPEAATGSYEHTMVVFPNGATDDAVDATTQHLNGATASPLARFLAAMEKSRGSRGKSS